MPRLNADPGRRRSGLRQLPRDFPAQGKLRTVDIVGDDEADPATNRISSSSTIGAQLGASLGDICAFGGDDQAVKL
ncbi:MAG: GreA/GreB family elongation factor [Sphingomonadales bacterium]|nr:GreA/GreB family elongation factor [Sphingomonadales bacterium]